MTSNEAFMRRSMARRIGSGKREIARYCEDSRKENSGHLNASDAVSAGPQCAEHIVVHGHCAGETEKKTISRQVWRAGAAIALGAAVKARASMRQKGEVMKVYIGRFDYETDNMAAYATGVASMPVIYVNENGAAFLEVMRPHWELPKVRYLRRTEALRLAQTCHLEGLMEQLRGRAEVTC
jgi:hypothetical protein